MIRYIVTGALLGVLALAAVLVSTVVAPAEAGPICNGTDVMRPCAPTFTAERLSKRETRRVARGQYLEERMPFGRAVARGEGVSEILGGRPAGCPHRFCGCGVSLKVFGRIIPRYNLAANWRDFAPVTPGGGTVAWRPGHVLYVEAHVSGSSYQVYDPNSGGGKIRRHVRNLAGYRFVNPHTRLASL